MDIFLVAIFVAVIYLVMMWFYRKQVIESYHNKYVFITGCDTGFGHLLAIRLDEMGFHVFAGCLTESGEDKLQNKASHRLVTLTLDVTNEKSILNAFEFIKSKLPKFTGLWGVVNNAGIPNSNLGPVEWLKKRDYENVLAVNLYGVIETARIFLPLVRLSRGRFVNMASIFGTVSLPAVVPYCISKTGVEAFSDCLRRECYNQGITIHIIEPGFFNTGFARIGATQATKKTFDLLEPHIREFYGEEFVSELGQEFSSFLNLVMSNSVHKVVDAYVHALTAKYPKYRYKVGWDANTLFRVVRWSPEWLADFILGGRFPVPKGMR